MTEVATLYGVTPTPCPPWAGFPGEVNPGGRIMVRDSNHPCFGCAMESEHNVHGRVAWEDGAEAAIPTENLWPDADFMRRAAEINSAFEWCGTGLFAPSPAQDHANEIYQEIMASVEVVSGSGTTLTLRSVYNPLDFDITRFVVNENWFPGASVPRLWSHPIRTAIQPGDHITFSDNSVVSGKIQCRVVTPPSSWAGSAGTWTVTVDQSVSNAHVKIADPGDDITATITRYALYPEQWPEILPSYHLTVARTKMTIAWEDVATKPAPKSVELFDTAGESCRVALPRERAAPDKGTFNVIRTRAGVPSDITSSAIPLLKIDHKGASNYQTTLEVEALMIDGDSLLVSYCPEATGSDVETFAGNQSICHHSKQSGGRWFCGLAARDVLDHSDGSITDDPPTGIASYREGSTTGCYQTTCSDFQARTPWDMHRDLSVFAKGLFNGYPTRLVQKVAGSSAPENFYMERLGWPSGVPGIGPMLRRRAKSIEVYHPVETPLASDVSCRVTGSGDSRRVIIGSEIDLVEDGKAGRYDLLGDKPDTGSALNRSVARLDGLGRPFDNTTDPYFGFRDAGRHMPGLSEADSGDAAGRTLGHYQVVTPRRITIPNVSITDTTLQTRAAGSAKLNDDGTLSLFVTPLDKANDSITGVALVTGEVAAASVDGDYIRIEIANQQYTGTYSPDPQSETNFTFFGGGKFVKLPPAYQPFDYWDDDTKLDGDVCSRGAAPGYALRFSLSSGANKDAINAQGFTIDRALPCEGTAESFNSDPPAEWNAAPRNYENWLNKRDVVWAKDQGALLADNLGDLVGATVWAELSGALSFLRVPDVATSEYAGDFGGLSASDIESVNYWTGEVVIKASVVSALDSTKKHCFQIEADCLDRRGVVRAEFFQEIQRRQARLFTVRIPTTVTSTLGIWSVFQQKSQYEDKWGLDMQNICDVEGSIEDVLLNETPCDPLILSTGQSYPSPSCASGWFVEDEARLFRTSASGPSVGIGAVETRISAPSGPSSNLAFPDERELNIQLNGSSALSAGFLKRWPGGVDSILSASARIKMSSVQETVTTYEFVGNGSKISVTGGPVQSDPGTASMRLGVYGIKRKKGSAIDVIGLLGTSATVTANDDEWVDVNLTDAFKQALRFKPSRWHQLFISIAPADSEILADSDIVTAMNNGLPSVEYTNYEPLYSGCDGSNNSVLNPDRLDIAGTYSFQSITWGGFTMEDIVVEFQPPADFGAGLLPRNADNFHNLPPKLELLV